MGKNRKKGINKKFVDVKEFDENIGEILKTLPKENIKEVKKEKIIEDAYNDLEEKKEASKLEEKVDILSRPITGLQTIAPGISYKQGSDGVVKGNYVEGDYGLASAYYLTEKEELDMNRVSHFEEEKLKFTPFFSAEQRDRARERARRLFPTATEEDIIRYESKLLRRRNNAV